MNPKMFATGFARPYMAFARNRQICNYLGIFVRTQTTSSSQSSKLAGKVAVVTAATDGIGFGIARRLARDGAKVMLSSRTESNVDKALKSLKNENLEVSGMVCNAGSSEQRKHMLKTTAELYGGIDILISNAGVNPPIGPILETTESQWDKIFDLNLKSAFFLTKEAVPYLEERGGGAIVFLSSGAGYLLYDKIATYGVSKTGLIALTKALAPQCASKNIRVNCVAPGLLKTAFADRLIKDYHDEILKLKTMKRLGEVDECTGAVSFLCSDEASYIT